MLGVIAATWAVVMALGPILQMRQIVRRGSSAGLSIGYLLVLIVGFALWIAYGAARHDLPLVVPNATALLVMGITIVVALRYRPSRPLLASVLAAFPLLLELLGLAVSAAAGKGPPAVIPGFAIASCASSPSSSAS